jgi:hypothetical protein
MTTAFVFESDTLTEADYDKLMAAMGLADSDASFPPGLLTHLAGPTPDGRWRVIDVWDSEASATRFYESDRFAPVRDNAAGREISSTPWPLHRIDVPLASDRS